MYTFGGNVDGSHNKSCSEPAKGELGHHNDLQMVMATFIGHAVKSVFKCDLLKVIQVNVALGLLTKRKRKKKRARVIKFLTGKYNTAFTWN